MKIGITYRLFLAILLAAGLAVVSNVLILQWSLGRGFLRYVTTMERDGVARLAATLEEVYHNDQGWEALKSDPSRWRQLIAASLPDEPPPHRRPPRRLAPSLPDEDREPRPDEPPPPHRPPPRLEHHFAERLFLLDEHRTVVIGDTAMATTGDETPLQDQGQIVGYLGFVPNTRLADNRQRRFLKEQKLAFTLIAGVVALLAAALSLLLARRLVRPLRGLADATHQLSAGDFSIRVPIVSTDELGQLASNFNTLALTLEKNEQARRHWVADISHELRTPLATLRCEIEALQDGIHRQPPAEALHSLHSEVMRLSLLVDDLYQLAMSDLGALTYRKEVLDLAEVVNEAVTSYRPEFTAKGIALATDLAPVATVTVLGDPKRLHQLFTNLLANSLKYTTSGGELKISMTPHERTVTIDFQDSPPGVAAADLPRLFDRLYRVEASRNRATGGAGLGLAICRNIVEAHQGTISAQPSPLGGLWIRVELVRTEEEP